MLLNKETKPKSWWASWSQLLLILWISADLVMRNPKRLVSFVVSHVFLTDVKTTFTKLNLFSFPDTVRQNLFFLLSFTLFKEKTFLFLKILFLILQPNVTLLVLFQLSLTDSIMCCFGQVLLCMITRSYWYVITLLYSCLIVSVRVTSSGQIYLL